MVVGKGFFGLSYQHPLGLGSWFSWSRDFYYSPLPTPPYNEIVRTVGWKLQQLCT